MFLGLNPFIAPEQTTELVNVSEVEVYYEVDITAMEFALTGVSHGQSLVSVANPKGTIPGLTSLFISWRFYALEALEYEFPLFIRYMPSCNRGPVSFDAGTPAYSQISSFTADWIDFKLSIKCSGYDPRKQLLSSIASNSSSDFTGSSPPSVQLLELPALSQPVSLSAVSFDFGVIPLGSTSSQIMILRNRLSTSVKFNIECPNFSSSAFGIITFTPPEGIIEGLSHVLINMSCSSIKQPKIFYDRIRISVREVFGTNMLSLSSTVLSRMQHKVSQGKVILYMFHNSHNILVCNLLNQFSPRFTHANASLLRSGRQPVDVLKLGLIQWRTEGAPPLHLHHRS